MIGSRLALLPLLLLPAAPARAQDAREALIRSIEQESQVSFAGRQTTDVTDRDKTRHAEQVVQRLAPDKLRIEYVAPARLKGELVVDDGQRLRRYIPSLRVVEEGPSQVGRSRQRQRKREGIGQRLGFEQFEGRAQRRRPQHRSEHRRHGRHHRHRQRPQHGRQHGGHCRHHRHG